MDAIERDNPSLKGVLPKEYAKEKLDKLVEMPEPYEGRVFEIITSSLIQFNDYIFRWSRWVHRPLCWVQNSSGWVHLQNGWVQAA